MSQQEMNYKGVNHEERPDFYQHSSATYGQKVHPHNLSREDALKARLWIAYISLALVMGAAFIYAYLGFAYEGGANAPGEPQVIYSVQILAIVFLVIIGLNVAINVFIAKRYKK